MTLRLFVDAPLHAGAELTLPPGPARHVQVRRAQPGDALVLFDGTGGEWRAEVLQMGRREVTVRLLAHDAVARESACAVTVALGMPANERMDALVEKATELGAAGIQPLLSERSVLRLAGERAERKQAHWQGIAVAASEQSGRTRVPAVARVRTLADWLGALPPTGGLRLLLSPGALLLPASAAAATDLTVLSGPEGGLTADEERAALAHGFVRAGLGERILRADTAPLAVLAWRMLQPPAG